MRKPVSTPEQREKAQKAWIESEKRFLATCEDRIKDAYLNIPKTQQRVFYSCYAVAKSKSDAIKAKCLDCCQYDRKEIELCNTAACPLHNFRPYRKSAK